MAAGGAENDILAEFGKENGIEINDTQRFRNILYNHVVDTIDNRISTQLAGVSNEHLHQFASDLFLGIAPIAEAVRNQGSPLSRQSEKCVLEVRVQRGESLAPKDVAGTSDPYCAVGISPKDVYVSLLSKKTVVKYLTSIKTKTLSPEWNECLEVPVSRDQIDSHHFHIQVWDRDDAGAGVANALGSIKNVKGIRGMGRYVKEVAQTVGSKDTDDFMGFAEIPLRNIPFGGLEKWFALRARNPIENISGRIRIGLKLTCPHMLLAESERPEQLVPMVNGPRIKNELSDEGIYGSILAVVVSKRHATYKDSKNIDQNFQADCWDGKLQKADETLLREFEAQRKIDAQACAVARWATYCAEHTQLHDGIEMRCMTDLLKALEAANDEKTKRTFQPQHPISAPGKMAAIFTFEKLPKSFDLFLRHCHQKIEDHTVIYPAKQADTIIRLGELAMCMNTLRESKLFLEANLGNTAMFGSGNVNKDISQSLQRGMEKYYEKTCEEHQALKPNISELGGGIPVEEYNVRAIIKLVEETHNAMINGQLYYHPVFKKVLQVDYISIALGVVTGKMSRDLREILYKINKTLSEDPDPVGEYSANKATDMFHLYLRLNGFRSFVHGIEAGHSPHEEFNELSLQSETAGRQSEANNRQEYGGLKEFHEWFRPTILRWLQMSRGRAIQRLKAAVDLDKVTRIDDIVKHSSSSVDAISCLSSVVTFWNQIKWPDSLDGFLIATRIIEDISNGAELYADLVHEKLKAVGFFDDEGQFDVTEELCLALNNLEKVRLFLAGVLREMGIGNLASKIDQKTEGPSGEQMTQSFQNLMQHGDGAMRRKIREVTSVVGKKMQPDIRRYFTDFVALVMTVAPKKPDGRPLNGHDSEYDLNRQQWEGVAEDAIGPLMKYLTSNVRTLKEWLCDSNFRILLDILWKACLQCMIDVVLKKKRSLKPYVFKLCRYVMKESFTVFFHAEGEGLELENMFAAEEYAFAETEIKMRGASTMDLMRLFFCQMYDDQQATQQASYGTLNVYSWYDTTTSEVKIDIISAENLLPRDVNGFSDPFVQINLMPRVIFPSQPQKQTLEKKKTLNPLFDGESFTFKIERELVAQEGLVIVFTVLDYDIIGKNELEGECVLPMNVLDGSKQMATSGRSNRTFRLNLTLPQAPKQSSADSNEVTVDGATPVGGASAFSPSSPLELLKKRISFDRDASEFVRWRKRVEDSSDKDESSGRNTILNSLFK